MLRLLKNISASWKWRSASLKANWIRRKWKARVKGLPSAKDGKRLLHVGCGDINSPGFINLDARPQPHVHIVTTSLFRLKMIPEDAVDLIYMSHVLEHVGHRELVATMREMRRILKNGGVLRVSVPDFDHIINIYQSTQNDIRAIEQPLMGGQDYAFNYHYAVFNNSYLRDLMLKSGFRQARQWDPLECEYHDFEDWASKNISLEGRDYPISLNIEAIK